MILTADCILSVTSPPLYHGAVAVRGSKIAAVGKEQEICLQFPDLPKRELKGCILMPGLVNAHTHLELSILKDRISKQFDFISWIFDLVQEKMKMTEDEIRKSVRIGVEQSLAEGTTCIGEITNTPESLKAIQEAGLRGLIFLEVLGKDAVEPSQWKEDLIQKIRSMQSECGRLTTIGLSPHTPYTLSKQRLQLLSELLSENPLPYTIHVAESQEEMEYFLHHKGGIKSRLFPFAGWEDLPDPKDCESPLAYLDRSELVTDRLLIAHGVHLSIEDLDRIKDKRSSLVICPRSNQMLGVGQAPVEEILRKGIPLGLGTDSLASNTSLSLWDEMRHLYTSHSDSERVTPDTILRMATLGGAKGLGLASTTGSIEVGKEADLISVNWRRNRPDDPAADLIEQTQNSDIRMVMVGGKILLDRAPD